MKRKIFFAIFNAFLLSFLIACGDSSSENRFNMEESVESEFAYFAEKETFRSKDALSDVCMIQDKLYIATTNEEEFSSGVSVVDLIERKESVVKIPHANNGKSIIVGMTSDNATNLVILEKYFASDTIEMMEEEDASHRIVVWNPIEDTIVSELDVTSIIQKRANQFIYGFETDMQGNYYLAIGKELLALSPDGQELFEIHPNMDWFVGIGATGNKQPAFLAYSSLGEGLSFNLIDPKSKQVVKSYSGFEGANDSGKFIGGNENEIYLSYGDKVFLCDTKSNVQTEKFCWSESRINDNDVVFFSPYGEDQFVAVVSDQMGNSYETQVAYFSKRLRSEMPTQKVLVLATFVNTKELQEAVTYYNSIQEECLIEIKDYCPSNATYQEQKELYRQMLLDITAGDGVDLFTTDFDCNQLVAAGLVENLYPYLESDPELGNKEFFQSVLDDNSVGEVLTNIPSFFYIEAMIGRESDFGSVDEGLLMEDVQKVIERKGDGSKLGIGQAQLLQNLLFSGFEKFVNWENGECNFEGEEFISIMNFAKDYGTSQVELNSVIGMPQNTLLVVNPVFNGLYYGVADGLVNEPAVYKGNPVWDKNETNGNELIDTLSFHICATSNNKEEAWDFVRSFLLDEYYQLCIEKTGVEYINFPIRKDVYDKVYEEWMATEIITDDDGKERVVSKYSYYVNGEEIRNPITVEEKEAVTNLIENAGIGSAWNPDIWVIVEEEVTPFFEGQKTAQDVAQIIQSRVRLYVSEEM